MMSLRKTAIVALASASVVSAGFATPAFAAPQGFDAARLDKAPAEYTQYYRGHRGWRGGNRGAAIAAGVGLGILGAAAVASSRRAYADPYYYDDGYDTYEPVYAPAPVYAAPVYAAPAYRRGYYRPSYDFRDHR